MISYYSLDEKILGLMIEYLEECDKNLMKKGEILEV